jgi:hypothetical protein
VEIALGIFAVSLIGIPFLGAEFIPSIAAATIAVFFKTRRSRSQHKI